ncbi:MAG: hypothetical protein LBE55_05170 [Clostridiales bacterium]|jgi:hypothetical protein|nr:hypothetical protein [Clostridiales bacterium]
MKNDKTISASEINRYVFCNYQWYYERKYGAAELRRQKKEYLEELGVKPSATGPIQRGLAFHARYGRRRRLRLVWAWLRAAAIIAVFLYFLFAFGMEVR